jgi:hypothetical protein
MLPESIAMLFAGINLVTTIPPYDARTDAEPLLHILPFLSHSPFVTRAGMHPRAEWEAMAAQVTTAPEATVVRAEAVAAPGGGAPPANPGCARASCRAINSTRSCATARRARALAIPFLRGDFVAFGRPCAALTPLLQTAVSTLTEARVRALRWMLGDAPWDAVAMGS